MTDADRLRAAADRLDTYADDFHSREFAHRASQDRVTAALLRAVADERVCGCFPWWTVDGVGGDTRAAALALASIILGAES